MSTSPRPVTVQVASWEIECCTPPPGLGDLVSWPLLAVAPAADRHGFDHPGQVTGWWRVERRDDATTLLVDGPVVAFLPDFSGAAPTPGVRELTVELVSALHYPAAVAIPPTTGRVRRVQILSHVFVHGHPRARWTPVPGTGELREVHRSPTSFDEDEYHLDRPPGGLVEGYHPEQKAHRGATGVLVELTL